MEKYKDEDWLREQYRERFRTQRDIAKECGVGQSTISRWTNKFNIDCSHKVTKTCKKCGEKFKVIWSEVKKGSGKFCSYRCARKYKNKEKARGKEEYARGHPLQWSGDIAYLTGLITSDGYLRYDRPMVGFCSKDKSLTKQVKEITRGNLNIGNYKISQENDGTWRYYFTSRRMYKFLKGVGLMSNKSHNLEDLDVPNNMFFDWLRGEIDGDGSWYIKKNKYLTLGLVSGSKEFLSWVSRKLDDYGTVEGKGNICEDDTYNVYRLRYHHRDSKEIANSVYQDAEYFLQRKYDIVKEFI